MKVVIGAVWATIGAGLGFLSLELAGVILLFTFIPAALVMKRHERERLPDVLFCFGVGYLASVVYFAIRTSGIFSGEAGSGEIAYFSVHIAIGVALIGSGVAMWLCWTASDLTKRI
ncbi:MAG: hypothetical protein ACREN2_09920 [Candidatus Dormibacteria bacterium]